MNNQRDHQLKQATYLDRQKMKNAVKECGAINAGAESFTSLVNDTTQIEEQQAQLEGAITELTDSVNCFIGRLEVKILRNELLANPCEGMTGCATPVLVGLAEHIRQQTERIKLTTEKIHSAYNRLEL